MGHKGGKLKEQQHAVKGHHIPGSNLALLEQPALLMATVGQDAPEYIAGLREAGFEGVEVGERLVYDAAQLRAILSEDIPDFDLDCDQVDGLLQQYAGSVWSARFMGRKPL